MGTVWPEFVFFDDLNLVKCGEKPKIKIEKFTNGWDGDVANGIPATGTGNFTVDAPQVAVVPSGGDITWTYVVTNTSDETLSSISVTDDRGVTVTCPAIPLHRALRSLARPLDRRGSATNLFTWR